MAGQRPVSETCQLWSALVTRDRPRQAAAMQHGLLRGNAVGSSDGLLAVGFTFPSKIVAEERSSSNVDTWDGIEEDTQGDAGRHRRASACLGVET